MSEQICYDILSRQKITLKKKEQLSEEQICCLYKMNLRDIIDLLTKWNLIKDSSRIEMLKINDKRNMCVHPSKASTLDPTRDSKEMIERISKILENEFKVESLAGSDVLLL